MSSVKEFFKLLITDGNKINESNIILGIATIMFIATDIVSWCKGLDMFFTISIAEHLLFIFVMSKSEHSKLDANEVVKGVAEVLKR